MPQPEAQPTRLECHILLIEDSPDDQRYIGTVLTKAGAEVTFECNGHSGVEQLARAAANDQKIDVILMDFQLPVLDGLATTKQLRERGFQQPVIAITAHSEPGLELKWRTAGCSEYLTKPVKSTDLVEAIARAVQPQPMAARR